MCEQCFRDNCWRCTGCWHEIEHDFSDRIDEFDDHYDMADAAADRYEMAMDREWGDAA